MIIIAGYVTVPQAVKAALQAPLENFVAETREEAGCREFSFAYDAVEPEKLRVYEIFDDRDAFEAHAIRRTCPNGAACAPGLA